MSARPNANAALTGPAQPLRRAPVWLVAAVLAVHVALILGLTGPLEWRVCTEGTGRGGRVSRAGGAGEKGARGAGHRGGGKGGGLRQKTPGDWVSQPASAVADGPDDAEIEAALAARSAAKAAKNYAEADRIRDGLKARGVLIEDSKDGQRWRRL